jgi:flagellar basal-body rod modification protein FlgD
MASLISSVTPTVSSSVNPSVTATPSDNQTLASNFTAFLQLLTTQLQNQNPLDPLDTNQFTQQLVQFAQVEQQLKQSSQLETLVKLGQQSDAASAMGYVGQHVVIDGATTRLDTGGATWAFAVDKPASATVTITDKAGQVAYTGAFTVDPGTQVFTWDGKGNNGTTWPAGDYTISVTAKDASGQTVAISTEVEGVIDSADLTKQPPLLMMGGLTFSVDKIKRILRQITSSDPTTDPTNPNPSDPPT